MDVISLYEQGESVRKISKTLNIHSETVKKKLIKAGIYVEGRDKRSNFSEEEKSLIKSLYTSGSSFDDIALRLKCKVGTVKDFTLKNNIRKPESTVIKWTDELVQQVVEAYEAGKSASEIAKTFNCSYTPIYRILRSNSSVTTAGTKNRKYIAKDDYFDNIDTEDKAYFLGWMFADGYNYENERDTSIAILTTQKDVALIEKFRDTISPGKPLWFNQRSKKNPNWQDTYTLKVNSKQLSAALVKHGCGQAKTYKIEFPTTVPEHLHHHFIRGYFDGDGYATDNRFEVVGTIKFLEKVQEIMIKKIGLNKTKLHQRHKDRDNNIRTLIYGGRGVMRKIYDYIYDSATVCLDRKKQAFNIQVNV